MANTNFALTIEHGENNYMSNKPMKHLLRAGTVCLLALTAAPLFALSGSGDSAVGSLDTIAPTPGPVYAPPTGTMGVPIELGFGGTFDPSGIAYVELWSRTDFIGWGFTGSDVHESSGTFFFPPTTGVYYFELVAEDYVGNRSTEPSGNLTIGTGMTVVSSGVADWSLFDQ